jgi:hypothetical protein
METPSFPTLRRRCPRGFAFYVAHSIRSIPALLNSSETLNSSLDVERLPRRSIAKAGCALDVRF